MGGIGSGIHRDRRAQHAERLGALSIDYLRRNQLLAPGGSFDLRWQYWGQTRGGVHVSVTAVGLALGYIFNGAYEQPEEVLELVRFNYTRTNFGGRRQWLVCPGCHKRCGKLYGAHRFGAGVACGWSTRANMTPQPAAQSKGRGRSDSRWAAPQT